MTRAHRGRRGPADRGAAAVEMALVLPVLLMMIFGIIDFGRMLNEQITLTEAAREGARAEAFDRDATAATNSVASNISGVTTTVQQSCPNTANPRSAKVLAQHQFQFVTPFGSIVSLFGGGPSGTLMLTGKGEMACMS